MKVIEIKVIFDSDNIEETQKEISDIFYNFGATGLKIDEPLKFKNPLDFYKDEKQFLMVDHAVSAYFPMNPYSQRRNEMIKNSFEERFNDRDDVVFSIDFYEYEEEDYQNSWKKYLYPEKVSDKFVVKPTWREYEANEGEFVIELDPGRAFGTGSHPTTSLCLKLMEENIKPGNSVIDVGTGSGILMIAAEKLGATEIYGTDIDELAVESTKENLELNHISTDVAQVHLGDLISIVKDKSFDVVVANILADVILLLLKDIFKVVKKDGLIIFSGIIDEKLPEIVKQVEEKGLEILEIKRDKEWRALLIKA
ncbi:50S ribosomal protein L11 methyltransferase [Cetobacterium sp. 8H]|uniref:50S ribosomal protein L11 methyltransferase n=1 Tax=Cetobacterium sp. 8H TaxID=2759681 RepID=UPI00163D21D7|nr:50S ribosomal protein L11 methyltransferase [Cetobacterium sp. 8H]MBC2850541.1 50S ribosomal protein L11 methyltransferase [Cetobacterium sp. 8H]